jgi:hypothetical protein
MNETSSLFSQVIQEHLDLKRKNADLEGRMPLSRYLEEDPFENHPLFKTEEQARIEDTMSGHESIESEPTPLSWSTDDTFIDEPPTAPDGASERDADSDSEEGLWTRSRDFDWGD